MKRGWIALGLAAGLAAAPVCADSLHLNSGVRLDGEVVKNDDGTYTLIVEGRRSIYRDSEIAVHEKNELNGSEYRQEAARIAEETERAERDRTGLTDNQRAEVQRILDGFNSSDRSVVRSAIADMVALGRRIEIVPYLESLLPSLTPARYPAALEAFCTLADASVARRALSDAALHPAPVVRAQAIRLMGSRAGSVALVARGLVDPAEEVRLAAANALGDLGAKEATPALAAAMENENAVIRTAIGRSLELIWDGVDGVPHQPSAADWSAFWSSKQSAVGGSIQLSGLEPLVDAKVKFVEG